MLGKPELPVSDNCFVSLSWPIIGKTELQVIRFIGKLSAARFTSKDPNKGLGCHKNQYPIAGILMIMAISLSFFCAFKIEHKACSS